MHYADKEFQSLTVQGKNCWHGHPLGMLTKKSRNLLEYKVYLL